MGDRMKRISFGQIRWLGWAILCSIGHPEVWRLQDWGNNTGDIAELIGMYFLFGLLLEFTYRKLAWRTIWPKDEMVDTGQSESVNQGWTSFIDQRPPEDFPLDLLCADGKIRKGKAIATSLDDRQIFEIDYEKCMRHLKEEEAKEFVPKYWRKSNSASQIKGESDVC